MRQFCQLHHGASATPTCTPLTSPLQSYSLRSLSNQHETSAIARRAVCTSELLVFAAPHRPCTFVRVPGGSRPRPQGEPTGRERYVTRAANFREVAVKLLDDTFETIKGGDGVCSP